MAGLLRACLLFLIALVVLGVLAYHFFGIWGFLGFAALCMFAVMSIKRVIGFGLQKAFMIPFKAKSGVLKDARLTVHSFAPTTAVEVMSDENEADDGIEPRTTTETGFDNYILEITISPKPPSGSFAHWEPGELMLVREDSKPEPDSEAEYAGTVGEIEILDNSEWKRDEGYKFTGEQRLRMQLGIVPGLRRFKLQYYFEVLGLIDVPGRSEASGAVIDQ
jgi:hypothetical protein